jgi:hypothetical protein
LVKADEELYKGTSEYYKDQEFGDGHEEELTEKMMQVYADHCRGKLEINLKIERARRDVLQMWTQKDSLRNVIERLKEIKSGHTPV